MGKKVKKTRWRALTLNGHQSDSEESSTKSSLQTPNYHQHKYTKFSYSSHSSPIRKYEDDSSKTTRSNSTTSEKKATFNEDEYTRITTPRQDVLFKKGYLNKPKVYQTQTSTGTCSTANSTSTCTPDHQSADGTEATDLEYESQFVFPNAFIDQNGIYYINSFEPFPFVLYNAPICYTEYPNTRTKRYSTDSMTESVSPHNEESGVTNVSTQPSDEQSIAEEPIRLKKKRRRKISRSKSITSDCSSESNEVFKTEDVAQTLLMKSLTKTTESKYSLKPDAEEFVPRNFRNETLPFDPNVQFFNIQPNFIPMPFINNVGELQRNFVPVNFIPDSKLYPNYVNNALPEPTNSQIQEVKAETELVEAKKNKTDIDIAKIVWKLEEAAKQQFYEDKKSSNRSPKQRGFQRPRFNRYDKEQGKPEAEPVWVPKKTISALPIAKVNEVRTVKCQSVPQPQLEKKPIIRVTPSPVRSPRKQNQWISVSSRKKRKNKLTEDDAEELEEALQLNDDLFECFDVNQLVDVVPASRLEQAPDALVETILPEPDNPQRSAAPEVKNTVPPEPDQHDSEVGQIKKKKKKAPKLPIKKVMVTDFPPVQKVEVAPVVERLLVPVKEEQPPEFSVECGETPVECSEAPHERCKALIECNEVTVEHGEAPVECSEAPVECNESPVECSEASEQRPDNNKKLETSEKKKKKKKKSAQLQKAQSVSSSNATLNCDDSYDFLIENSILEEFEQKTNVEMSQELDRMIQKGMYNHLEEKIKAININLDDAFFKAIVAPPTPVVESQPSTSKFTWNSQEFQDKGEDKQNTTIHLTNIQNFSVPSEPVLGKSPSPPLYPITQAVKEWMTKTRENTPDIEILKSPNTINKEFGESDSDSGRPDDDVTIWSINGIEEVTECDLKLNGKIEDCEEAIEVYDSNYGNNEDFLKIKSEVEAQRTNRNFPRHGNLPYRAICCNLM